MTSSDAIVRDLDRRERRAKTGSLGEPLSDLGAAVIGHTAYIAGGYTGSQYATGILAFRGGTPQLAARLPVGLRYAGVAALGGQLYVAGGITTTGTSSAVYRFDPATGVVAQVATLPQPVAHAPLVALGGSLYLIGGDGSSAIERIAPNGSVAIAGRLPAPLANAAAVTLGGSIYVFGGDGSDAVRSRHSTGREPGRGGPADPQHDTAPDLGRLRARAGARGSRTRGARRAAAPRPARRSGR